jgi:hypothetical protein
MAASYLSATCVVARIDLYMSNKNEKIDANGPELLKLTRTAYHKQRAKIN